jgi:hypothetical protein
MIGRRIAGWAWLVLGLILLASLRSVEGAVPVDLVRTDLSPLIRDAARSPVQFAVHVRHAVSVDTAGSWSVVGERAIWRYAVRIPTAVSMSFHAIPVHLPSGSKLIVRSATTTVTYDPQELTGSDFWSRIQPGDTLEFTLDVASIGRSAVAFQIISFQAGYRGLGRAVPDHPYYRKLQLRTASTGNNTCVQNYMCSATTANTPLAQATVGIVVGNAYQCTGTLINDVPHDNTPYVLTARHCEDGVLGAGDDGQASGVTVYWDAATPCGQTLGAIYDPGSKTQTGATTIVVQQDAWLIQLNANPVVADAQFAGFDASAGTIQGGYTIHHALGNNKQFTGWFGQAVALQRSGVLGVTYQSDFWEVVNQLGNIGPGASGSALIDQNNHLVGSLTLGRTTSDTSGYGTCPASPPAAPNGSNGVADFTSLAAVWNSTADTTSNTGSRTIKSVLDPANTGTLVVPSMAAAAISFTASTVSLQTGESAQLSWNVPNATQCSASGGLPGDGWSGTLPGSGTGTQAISEGFGGAVRYKLTCQLAGGGSVSSSVQIAWNGSVPFVQVYLPRFAVWTTRPAEITWTSNVSPCAISGGGLSLSGLPSSGSTTATQSTPGDVTYLVSCGSGPTATAASATETYVLPSLLLIANGTDRLLNARFTLGWLSYADTCTPSGGAPNDGWATSSFGWNTQDFSPRVSTLGTYTYTLSCSSGPLSVQQSVTVTFENNAPYVTASVTPSTTTYSASPADYVTVNWTTNMSGCGINSTPYLGNIVGPQFPIPGLGGEFDGGPFIVAPHAPGTYALSVTCAQVGSPITTSAPVTVTILPPPPPTATLSISPSTPNLGEQQFTVTWSSTNATNCTETGNGQSSGTIWVPGSGADPSGSLTLGPADEVGQFTFGITCQSIDSNQGSTTAEAKLTVAEPTAILSASATTVTQGQTLTLTWSSTGTSQCTASGGGANGLPWSGTLDSSGTVTQTTTTVGKFTYSIMCGSRFPAQAQTAVTVTSSSASGSSSGGSSGGSGGGGGAINVLEIQLLTLLAGGRALARRRPVRQLGLLLFRRRLLLRR